MDRIRLLIALTLTLSLLAACNGSQRTIVDNGSSDTLVGEVEKTDDKESNNTSENVQPDDQVENEKSQHEEFDKWVEKYVSAINSRDVDTIRQYVESRPGEICEEGGSEGILDDYMTVFNNSNNVRYRFIGRVPNTGDEAFIYDLYDDNGKVIEIEVRKLWGTYLMGDTCFNYSAAVHQTIKNYTDALKSKDSKNIVGFLIPEGRTDVYPISDAEKTLEKYTQAFDLSTIEYKLKDIVGRSYIYNIYGTKNGQIVKHEVEVGCGNELTGIRDSWIPQYDE